MNERYTIRPVDPVTAVGADAARINSKTINPELIQAADGEEPGFSQDDVSRSYGAPTSYLEPISLRFGVRATF